MKNFRFIFLLNSTDRSRNDGRVLAVCVEKEREREREKMNENNT